MKTKIAILGIGRWGTNLLRNFLHHPQAEVVAIVDPDEKRLEFCSSQFDLNLDNITLATDWQSIRNLEGIEAVVIVTPAISHYELITDALQLGYHVLAEKPLTLDAQECIELTRLAEKQNLKLLVDHTYLFNSAVTAGKEALKSNKIGKLRYGYASRTNLGPVRQDVNALWDLAIHDISIFNHWLGQKPIQVQASGSIWLQEGLEDLVWVRLIYEDGFQAYIHLCWLNPDKQRKLCVVGDQGSLIFDEIDPNPLVIQQGYFQQEGQRFIPEGVNKEVLTVEKSEPLGNVCDYFLNSIQSKGSISISSGFVAAELVQILSCLNMSLQENSKMINVAELNNS